MARYTFGMPGFRILSVIPPMTQLNTPYPSTAYLTGFLRSRGFAAEQVDLSLGLALKLLSADGLQDMHARVGALPRRRHTTATRFFADRFEDYRATIAPAIRFLQGRDPTLAHRIASRRFLPEGPRFATLDGYVGGAQDEADALDWAFGALGLQDRAKHLATLYLNDLADVIRDAVDPRFEFVRYAESLASSQPDFEPLHAALAEPHSLVDGYLHALTLEALSRHRPDLVLVTAPFPGNVYGAFRIAQSIKQASPALTTVLGGGYCNTELRSMDEPRVFDYFDFVTLDAGERPLLALIEHLRGERPIERLVRTYTRERHYVDFQEPDIAFSDSGTPTYAGLPLDDYLSLLDLLNPMHRLWSDGRWNKLTVAHGCYWKKCSFCDVNLDYISRYDLAATDVLVDRIESLVRETGQTGFHFVDEAAPPKALKSLANALLQRQLSISWWGNIRFEKSFTAELCRLLAESGCIAVTGGLEVASDRLLGLMKKGVSVEQVARVTRAFSDAGILVHAYLMYGFPTQTVQDTVDALEYVRQLFAAGCIQSGFFHRFTCTVHSPVGRHPEQYGVTLHPPPRATFASNGIGFTDPGDVDHDALGVALRALYNYMHGVGLERGVREWFEPDAAVVAASDRAGGRGAPCRGAARRPAHYVPPDRIRARPGLNAACVLIAFNKPFGVACKFSPEPGRRTLADFIDVKGVYPASRLDTDSEGLLLLTDDGILQAHRQAQAQDREGLLGTGGRLRRRRGSRALRNESTSATSAPGARGGTPDRGNRQGCGRAILIRYRAEIPTSWIELTLREGKNRRSAAHDGQGGIPDAAAGARRDRRALHQYGGIAAGSVAGGRGRRAVEQPPGPGSSAPGHARPVGASWARPARAARRRRPGLHVGEQLGDGGIPTRRPQSPFSLLSDHTHRRRSRGRNHVLEEITVNWGESGPSAWCTTRGSSPGSTIPSMTSSAPSAIPSTR
ncbi:MAG: radical SAM protein [Steroidobacteraceae bacterium]